MRPVERVEVHRSLTRQEPLVRRDRVGVGRDDPPVVPAQHVDVGRHMEQVAAVGHQRAERVGRPEGTLGVRRHLHQVDVHVQHAGMRRARRPLQRELQHPPRLRGVRAGRGPARRQIPQLPRRHVHQRVGEQGGDVEVARVIEVGLAHRPGVALVPCRSIHRRLRRRVAGGDRGDERLLGRARAAGAGQRPLGRPERLGQRRGQIGGVEGIPRLVVVRAGRVGHSPVGHGAAGVGLDGPLEAADRLLVIERIRPDEAPVEPQLRIRRRGRHRPVVAPEVEVAGHSRASPCIAGSFRRGNATPLATGRP